MSRVLVIHAERGPRRFIEGRAAIHHKTESVGNLASAVKSIVPFRPDVLIAGLDKKRTEALDLLRYLKRSGIKLPVIVVSTAGAFKPMAMKLGAAAFVEYPMEQEALDRAISQALQDEKDAHGDVPPISQEEMDGNLSEFEKQLNRRMICFAGKNQVYLQSLIIGNGKPSKPRIALKCSLRKKFQHPPNVYYEYIRDVCCDDPSACPAHEAFNERNPMQH